MIILQYNSRDVDIYGKLELLSAWYFKINPAAVVPTLIHKGK